MKKTVDQLVAIGVEDFTKRNEISKRMGRAKKDMAWNLFYAVAEMIEQAQRDIDEGLPQ